MRADTATIVGLVTPVNLRFVVPVYQRPYTWGQRECAQLWDDIVTVGRAAREVRLQNTYGGRNILPPAHFTGSIVWVQDSAVSPEGVESRLLIDGQQRVTTLMLVFIALARFASAHQAQAKALSFSAQEILDDGYLTNKHRQGADHYKLTLSKTDQAIFQALVDELEVGERIEAEEAEQLATAHEQFGAVPVQPTAAPEQSSVVSKQSAAVPEQASLEPANHLRKNLAFFEQQLQTVDPNIIWLGIQQLQVASIALTEGQDNPQLVFESMNSTGKDLSSADLVRNFILMSAPIESQESLYRSFWRPIEEALHTDSTADLFEHFLHDWLTATRAPATFEQTNMYAAFKRYVRDNGYSSGNAIIKLINQLRRSVRSYMHITQGEKMAGLESQPELDTALADLRLLVQPQVHPLLLFFHDAYTQQDIDAAIFEKLLRLCESYLMRRRVCGYATDGEESFFSQLIARLEGVRAVGGDFVVALASYLLNEEDSTLRFPLNDEFAQALAWQRPKQTRLAEAFVAAANLGEQALVRWAYPELDEATRSIYRRSSANELAQFKPHSTQTKGAS